MRRREFADLNAFAAIVEHGSFARAAAHLGVTPSALSQTIRSLEERIGVRLLNRTTRSVAPSVAGTRLLSRLLPALSEVDAAVGEARTACEAPTGTVRINVTSPAAKWFLAPLVSRFLAAHPDIVLDIVIDDRLTDIVAHRFDAGIRFGEWLEKDMVAVRLSDSLEMMAVASPQYFDRHGRPQTPRDLGRHRCINWRMPTDGRLYRWKFERRKRALEIAVDGPLIVNDVDLAVRAALDGVGITYLSDRHVEPFVRDGRLERVLTEWSPSMPGFYLYYPSRRQMPASLRVFVDFVHATLTAKR